MTTTDTNTPPAQYLDAELCGHDYPAEGDAIHVAGNPVDIVTGKYTDTQVLYMILLALEEGLEGVRGQDLDDLLIKMIAEHWGTADEDTSPEEAEAAFAQLEPYIPDHMRAPGWQEGIVAIEGKEANG